MDFRGGHIELCVRKGNIILALDFLLLDTHVEVSAKSGTCKANSDPISSEIPTLAVSFSW